MRKPLKTKKISTPKSRKKSKKCRNAGGREWSSMCPNNTIKTANARSTSRPKIRCLSFSIAPYSSVTFSWMRSMRNARPLEGSASTKTPSAWRPSRAM